MSAIGISPSRDTTRTTSGTAAHSGLRGQIRVLLRQHRRVLWGWGALLLLGVGVVVALRIWVTVAGREELCADGDITPCGDDVYQSTYARTSAETFLADGGTAMMVLAVLVGAFVAGPLIARELESGTFRMAWAQSSSPAQWLAARLAVPAALAASGAVVLVPVYHWGRSQLVNSPYVYGLGWYQPGVYPVMGPVSVGYVLLAVAVGALIALLVRRTLVSIAVSVLVLGLVMKIQQRVREDLWPTARALGDHRPKGDVWWVDSGMLTAAGKEVYRGDCPDAYTTADPGACMRELGGVTEFGDYHPASHFWPLQIVETGILLALAALAVLLTFRVLRRRHG
ncbi:ABC transporter permease [Streptomyces sp. MMS24-I29]|uniref:ABC transporter permease n=1 Tax=Streptomyces sp. MMS24-I29 TaxID=3351480 RepID=UPI003C7E7B71